MAGPKAMNGPEVRTLIFQPDRLCREGLTRILGDMEDVRLLPPSATAAEALQSVANAAPDVVLMEVDLPDGGGLELVSQLTQRADPPRVVLLTTKSGHAYVTAAMARGAAGYVLRTASAEELKEAIRQVSTGGTYIQPALAASLTNQRFAIKRERELSERECDLLIHLARGATNQEIATSLFLGEKTVRNALTRLFHKLEARNRTEAVAIARDAGYL